MFLRYKDKVCNVLVAIMIKINKIIFWFFCVLVFIVIPWQFLVYKDDSFVNVPFESGRVVSSAAHYCGRLSNSPCYTAEVEIVLLDITVKISTPEKMAFGADLCVYKKERSNFEGRYSYYFKRKELC
jgi:hypothetical protein